MKMESTSLSKYYRMLHINKNASLEEVKKAYHNMAKKNHPDLFPENQRHIQQLKMMSINEAYMSIISHFKRMVSDIHDDDNRKDEEVHTSNINVPADYQVGPLRDPAYTYYKRGFTHYTEGYRIFHSRFMLKKYSFKYINFNKDKLQLAIRALQNFEKSYYYFMRVVSDYSDSIWARDAGIKLQVLEKINMIYHKICKNLSARSKTRR
jgi:hypothetical protein